MLRVLDQHQHAIYSVQIYVDANKKAGAMYFLIRAFERINKVTD